jgi:cation transporter-like permease
MSLREHTVGGDSQLRNGATSRVGTTSSRSRTRTARQQLTSSERDSHSWSSTEGDTDEVNGTRRRGPYPSEFPEDKELIRRRRRPTRKPSGTVPQPYDTGATSADAVAREILSLPVDHFDNVESPKSPETFHDKGRQYLSLDWRGVWAVVSQRTSVLVSLLLLQSLSQFILEMYEGLISSHVIIPLFLTMLVGAGGNAGNQATVRAITGLVTGEFRPSDFLLVMRKEIVCGLLSSIILSLIGFCRVYFLYGIDHLFWSTIAITLSLFTILLTSIVLGCTLPFFLGWLGFDREHAAPVISVMMDILGVFITCTLCSALIPPGEHRSSAHGTNVPVSQVK